MHKLFLSNLLIASLLVLQGCGLGGEEDADVAGAYTAESFIAIIEGEQVDVLEVGGSLEMNLAEDGTFDGHLFLPRELLGAPDTSNGADPDTSDIEDLDVDLDGTYEVSEDVVSFSTGTDLFIGGAPWLFADDQLRWSSSFIVVVLNRQ